MMAAPSQTEFAALLGKLETEFGKQYSRETAGTMFRRLKVYPKRAIDEAIQNLILEEKFFPKYRELHDAVRRVMSSRGWHEIRKESEEKFKCLRCEDTGIQFRRYRKDLAKDFYCLCQAGQEITHHDWTEGPWSRALLDVGSKAFSTSFRKAAGPQWTAMLRLMQREETETIELTDEEIPF
jgi:hypothetical protein